MSEHEGSYTVQGWRGCGNKHRHIQGNNLSRRGGAFISPHQSSSGFKEVNETEEFR